MKKILLTLVLGMLVILSFGQPREGVVCGTTPTAEMIENIKRNAANFNGTFQRGGTSFVPIKFHLVANSDENGRISESRVFKTLKFLNDNYSSMGIQFYIKDEFNYLDKSTVYDAVLRSSGTDVQLSIARVSNALNVFLVNSITTSGIPGTILGVFYRNSSIDDLLVLNQEIGTATGTLEHEIGHFFSLLHTFNGWDGSPWQASEHGNPVGEFAPRGGFPRIRNELVDGSNCANSGDFLCDTPADYNLGFFWNNCADYDGDCMDLNMDTLRPQENNYMGYFLRCPDYEFSDQQKSAINTSLNSNGRSYVRSSYIPFTGDINDPKHIYPVDVDTGADPITFEWEAVEGGKWYLLEIGRNSSMTIGVQRYFVSTNEVVIDDLTADRNYFWRVQTFGEYKCFEGTPITTAFTTNMTTSTEDPNFVESFNLFPNPVQDNKILTLSLESSAPLKMDAEIYGQNGQLTKSFLSQPINEGNNMLQLDLNGLSAGIYILKMKSSEGNIVRKITVL